MEEAPALRLCMLAWVEQRANNLPFLEVPVKVVERGENSTQAYLDDLNTSFKLLFRAKVCLVGNSGAGKTSFVISIISERPYLVKLDDRTIAIDHFPLRIETTNIYEVTFWDFAGQDPYQMAHSAFFSASTSFFVFIDLQSFSIAIMQAIIFADHSFQEPKLLDEFVERAMFHWIRMILTRQPDAELYLSSRKMMCRTTIRTPRI